MVHVSRYDEAFREGLDQALAKLPDDHKEMIDKVADTICEGVQERVRGYTADYMAENLKDDLSARAQEVAESMLMNALAGDDRALRNLFGFNDYYMRNLYVGRQPTQWALLDALIERKPDLFRDEKIKQQAAQIEQWQREAAGLKNYWEGYEVSHHDGEYVTLRKKREAA